MTRNLLAFLLCGLLGIAAGAQQPKPDEGDGPVRLKKKPPMDDKARDDKKPDDKAKDDKKPDDKAREKPKPVEPGPGAKEDEKEVLARVAKNMKRVEEKFAKNDLSEDTLQIQDDIIKDLASLIQMAENPPPPQSGESGPGMLPPPSGDNQEDENKQGRQQSGPMNQPGTQPNGMKQSGMQPSGMKPGGTEQGSQNPMPGGPGGKKPGAGGADKGGGAEPPNNDGPNGQWGHLPESLRAQLNAYATQEEYMAKYQELIREYYRNLARQGRNK